MNLCVLILLCFISTILLIARASEVSQPKRMQTEPSTSNKKLKNEVLSAAKNVIDNDKKFYVAVIGGGINAALFTHYLHELINAEVHIYNHGMIEKTENSLFLIHKRQKYMMEMVSKFNLDTKDLNQPVVMYDELKNLVLNFHQNDPIKPFIEYYIKCLIQKFEKIYDIQQKELRSFISLSSLLQSMSSTFPKLLKISTRQFILEKPWQYASSIKKIINSLLLLNYGQNLESNAFAGLTSLIFSQSTGKLKRITTSIGQLIKKLVGESDQLFNTNVSEVTYEKVSRFVFRPQVNWIGKDGKKLGRTYDYIVIATSEIGGIDFSTFKKPIVICKKRNMIFTTVTASLKEDVSEKSNLVMAIANVKDSGFIRLASKISNSDWKIIADDNNDNSCLDEISSILNITGISKVKKMALWPDYSDKECAIKAKFVLHPKLFYLNAIEWASTLLEMKAIAARNVALRIKNIQDQIIGLDYAQKFFKPFLNSQS